MVTSEQFMERAIVLARRGKGRTAPNPAVGALIIKNGVIIGEGWHKKAGGHHAEVMALRKAGSAAKGAEAFVTLEPCNHQGRTGPCSLALIDAGIKAVYFGAKDTSSKQGRKGAAALKRAGVKVVSGILKDKCQELVADFSKHSSTGLPLVTLKTAMTLDGKIASLSGDSRWISGEKSRRLVHSMRSETDAVMIGSDTALQDNPELTVRHGPARRNPMRVIIDSRLRTPEDSKLAKTAREVDTAIFTTKAGAVSEKAVRLSGMGLKVMAAGVGARVDLLAVLKALGEMNVMSLLVESGGALAWELLRLGLVDRVRFFIAPKLAGGPGSVMAAGGVDRIAEAYRLEDMKVFMCGEDVVIDAIVPGKEG